MVQDWNNWRPEISLVLLESPRRELGPPLADYVRGLTEARVIVLIGEVQPARLWERMLKNRRGTSVARRLSRGTDAVVCRYRMPLRDTTAVGSVGWAGEQRDGKGGRRGTYRSGCR